MGSYACGFNLMKTEYHEIDKLVVLSVKRERNKQQKNQQKKRKSSNFKLFIFCPDEKRKSPWRHFNCNFEPTTLVLKVDALSTELL